MVYIARMKRKRYISSMADLRVRKLPDEVWRALKHLAVDNDKSLNSYVVYVLSEHVGKAKKKR